MRVIALLALAGLTPFAFAASKDANTTTVPTEVYTYGMHLDVARVIATTDLSHTCGVAPATMTYEDHQGHLHRLQYELSGGGCSED